MSYRVVLYYKRPGSSDVGREIILSGLSYADARKHTEGPEGHYKTAESPEAVEFTRQYGEWFAGYEQEPEPERDYEEDARSDARETAEYYLDEIVSQLAEGEQASDDLLNDYAGGDSHHHENHVDKDYDLQEAAKVLSDLSYYEETDDGLWEGLEPERAISAQAAYTYGNAVYAKFQGLIAAVNEDLTIEEIQDAIGNVEGVEEPDAESDAVQETYLAALKEAAGEYWGGTEESADDFLKTLNEALKARVREIIEEF